MNSVTRGKTNAVRLTHVWARETPNPQDRSDRPPPEVGVGERMGKGASKAQSSPHTGIRSWGCGGQHGDHS